MASQYPLLHIKPGAEVHLRNRHHAIFRTAVGGMQALAQGGFLLTCSCSYQVDQEKFQTIVFHAARQAKRSVRILQRHHQATDHPVNIYHPETDYLKSLLLWVE